MTYEQAIDNLFSRHQSVQTAGFSPQSYKPGLDAMRRFDDALGNPAGHLRCIHVAGTNGKGSVSSMLAAALAASGYRVGLYTSPHLVDFRERIKILDSDGCHTVSREFVLDFLGRYDSLMQGLSFFEITTGMAFAWFSVQAVDWAVIETGLGGRLDSTNIITPELSVITSVGLDHCAILGDTCAAIAAEKAGIFKPGVPALVAARDPETEPVFRAAASRLGSPLYFADEPAGEQSGVAASIAAPSEEIFETLDLKGPGQRMNLRTALRALQLLGQYGPAAATGLRHFGERTCLRGRWEKLCENPELICDIGHNPPALELNFVRLKRMRAEGSRLRPLTVVYGVMRDKDLGSILHLFPEDAKYIFCAPSTPRALGARELFETVMAARPGLDCSVGPDGGNVRESVLEALRGAKASAEQGLFPIIYVGGSTFVVSEALSIDKELLSCTLHEG